jgi:hypothetical protein
LGEQDVTVLFDHLDELLDITHSQQLSEEGSYLRFKGWNLVEDVEYLDGYILVEKAGHEID